MKSKKRWKTCTLVSLMFTTILEQEINRQLKEKTLGFETYIFDMK